MNINITDNISNTSSYPVLFLSTNAFNNAHKARHTTWLTRRSVYPGAETNDLLQRDSCNVNTVTVLICREYSSTPARATNRYTSVNNGGSRRMSKGQRGHTLYMSATYRWVPQLATLHWGYLPSYECPVYSPAVGYLAAASSVPP